MSWLHARPTVRATLTEACAACMGSMHATPAKHGVLRLEAKLYEALNAKCLTTQHHNHATS